MNPPPLALRPGGLFATPFCLHDVEGRDAVWPALTSLVHAAATGERGVVRSNAGPDAWHSDSSFVDGDGPALGALRALVREASEALLPAFLPPLSAPGRLATEGWANRLGPGGYNAPHAHPGATLSLVVYASGDAPSEAEGPLAGRLELLDPRPLAARGEHAPPRCLIAPRPGRLVAFPGWLHHMVHPSRQAAPRVSFAFNVTALPS